MRRYTMIMVWEIQYCLFSPEMIQNNSIQNSESFFAEIDIDLKNYPKKQIIQKYSKESSI